MNKHIKINTENKMKLFIDNEYQDLDDSDFELFIRDTKPLYHSDKKFETDSWSSRNIVISMAIERSCEIVENWLKDESNGDKEAIEVIFEEGHELHDEYSGYRYWTEGFCFNGGMYTKTQFYLVSGGI